MEEYHKIQTIYKRDPETKFKTLLHGSFSKPEFEYLANTQWVGTEKVDGTNIRVMFADDGDGVEFRGKTDRAQIPDKLIKRLEERFFPQLEKFKSNFPYGVCLYGEGYGAKIQRGGGNYRRAQDFVLFDAWVNGWWLKRGDVEAIAESFGIDLVPVVFRGTLLEAVEIVRNGFNSRWGSFSAEGLVLRPAVELMSRDGERVITKIKHKDFKGGE